MTTYNQAEAETRKSWQLDPEHTLVEFAAKHMMISTVKGRFNSVRATLIYDHEFTKSLATATSRRQALKTIAATTLGCSQIASASGGSIPPL